MLLNVRYIVDALKKLQLRRIQKAIARGEVGKDVEDAAHQDPTNMEQNWAQIDRQLYAGFFFSILKLLAWVITVSYFFAMTFKVLLDL